jgi:hypothetical protein
VVLGRTSTAWEESTGGFAPAPSTPQAPRHAGFRLVAPASAVAAAWPIIDSMVSVEGWARPSVEGMPRRSAVSV